MISNPKLSQYHWSGVEVRDKKDQGSVKSSPDPHKESRSTSFHDLGINKDMARNLALLGITTPTDIQRLAIPHILRRNDVIMTAQTGSGKTLTYLLPILQLLPQLRRERRRHAKPVLKPTDSDKTNAEFSPLVWILVPTRELAHQVLKVLHELSTRAALLDGSEPSNVATMTETDTEHRTSATSQQPSTHLRFSATLFPIPPGLPASHLLTTLSSPDIAVAVPNGLIRHCTRFGLNTQKQETEAWTDLMRDAKVVVVDEADMVLENPEGKNVLQTMAKMGPQRARIHPIADEETPHALPATAKRPFLSKYKAKKQTTILTFERSSLQFLFVAATLPVARVADSRNCGGYLADMFPRAAKIATEGVHRTPRTLRERFIHVDVGIGGLDKETDQRNEVEEQDGHSVGFTQDATSSSLPPFPNAQAARDFASKYKRFLPILIETLTGERSNAKNSNPPGFSYLETWIVFCNSAARVRRVEAQLASDREAIDQTVDRLKGKTGGSFRWRVDTLHAELHRDERLKRIAPYLSRHSKQADSFPWLPDATIKTHVSSRASTPSGDDIVAEIRTRTQGEPERDLRILICTDVAARGIDFGNDVGRVIQFDFAANAASYVHRAGRTARCGRDGESKYRAVVNLIDSILLNMGAAALSVRFALLNFPFLFLSTSQQHEVISFVSPSDNPLAQFIELAAQGGTNKKLSSSALGYPPSTPSITGKIPSDHLAAGVAAESSQETLDMSEIGGGEKTDESVGVSKTALTGLFSRKRSFSKKLKKRRRRMEHVGRPDGGKEKN